jgi:hypothetical protein
MKKTLLVLMLPLMFRAQTEEKQSNIEKFSEQAGKLIEKNFSKIGETKFVEIEVLKVKDINAGKDFSALRLIQKVSLGAKGAINAIDQDEVDALTKSMNAMFSIFNTTRETYTEVSFTSRSGFKVGSYYSSDKIAPVSSSKNEKVYVETKESMFEGKVVNKDEKGSYIWKAVVKEPETSGKWKIYIEWELLGINATSYISIEEFKSLLSLVEQAKGKM